MFFFFHSFRMSVWSIQQYVYRITSWATLFLPFFCGRFFFQKKKCLDVKVDYLYDRNFSRAQNWAWKFVRFYWRRRKQIVRNTWKFIEIFRVKWDFVFAWIKKISNRRSRLHWMRCETQCRRYGVFIWIHLLLVSHVNTFWAMKNIVVLIENRPSFSWIVREYYCLWAIYSHLKKKNNIIHAIPLLVALSLCQSMNDPQARTSLHLNRNKDNSSRTNGYL